ncbi:unnamed protein product [Mycena citricolor]|uniref:RlpA-like protein double-psi beta-barrel domain-containing protein n=1 Tax=Mycena citricolor TaxID=2018698 RepID=A0AAD2Q5W2_9AGAR|nr:unnamed protein product [Mycena citricolor]CAK5279698.1 unnamed protein product [Mycena citricolor]
MFALAKRTLALLAAAPILLTSAQSFSGSGTFFNPGLGACGIFNTNADFIVAVSAFVFDTFPGATSNPNANPICGRRIVANFQGRSVVATVTDRCAGCAGTGDLDFSPAAFSQLADPSVGRIFGVTWNFI